MYLQDCGGRAGYLWRALAAVVGIASSGTLQGLTNHARLHHGFLPAPLCAHPNAKLPYRRRRRYMQVEESSSPIRLPTRLVPISTLPVSDFSYLHVQTTATIHTRIAEHQSYITAEPYLRERLSFEPAQNDCSQHSIVSLLPLFIASPATTCQSSPGTSSSARRN